MQNILSKFVPSRAVIAGIVCALAVMPTASALAQSSRQVIEVNISKFAFEPKELTIAPGTRVKWINHDEAPHTVAGVDKRFASKGLDTDDTFEYEFVSEGDFPYICTVHPFMTGVVHVRKR